jgi:hypothetical protein
MNFGTQQDSYANKNVLNELTVKSHGSLLKSAKDFNATHSSEELKKSFALKTLTKRVTRTRHAKKTFILPFYIRIMQNCIHESLFPKGNFKEFFLWNGRFAKCVLRLKDSMNAW